MEWYQKAAAIEFAQAQYHIGYLYENGFGVEKNYEKALEWYQKAAAQGDSDAQKNLDRMLLSNDIKNPVSQDN